MSRIALFSQPTLSHPFSVQKLGKHTHKKNKIINMALLYESGNILHVGEGSVYILPYRNAFNEKAYFHFVSIE